MSRLTNNLYVKFSPVLGVCRDVRSGVHVKICHPKYIYIFPNNIFPKNICLASNICNIYSDTSRVNKKHIVGF